MIETKLQRPEAENMRSGLGEDRFPKVKEAQNTEIAASLAWPISGSICWQLRVCKRTKEAGWGEQGMGERDCLGNECSP